MPRKYSALILEEAFKVALEEGEEYAAKKTGVGLYTLKPYVQKRRRELGIWNRRAWELFPHKQPKYSTASKIACIKLALKLYNGGYYKSIAKAMDNAAKKFGMRPKTILTQWQNDQIYPCFSEAQQPGTFAALPGSSNQTATPQGQSLMEQCKALKSLWPAPRIRRRREYTGPREPRSE